jgi:acetyltransferase-like isoleucine patch superfamily enzyme
MTVPFADSGSAHEPSVSRDEALDLGLLTIGEGSTVAPSVRIVPVEDNGDRFGPVEIGAGTIVRDGVVLGTGTRIGDRVLIGHHCVLRRRVHVGNDSVLSHLISVQHDVTIGARVRISSLTHITGGTLIEDEVVIGAGVATVDDNAMEWPSPRELRGPIFRRGCKVGSGATILGGVEIGANTLIGAGSVVTRSMPEGVIAFGNPAYIHRDRTEAK